MSAISTGPPPWPIPPSWTPPSPAEPPAEQPPTPAEPATPPRPGAVVVFASGGPSEGGDVETRPVPGPADGPTDGPTDGLALAHELARAAAQAAGEGAPGIVVAPGVAAPEELAWALDLLYPGEAPLAYAPGPEDLADAVAVAASGVRGLGCVLVSRGEIHAARHVARAAAASFASPAAGPLGRVAGDSVRLLWRPPGRVTVTGPAGDASPLVGLYTAGLGEDGRGLRALAEHCDGLVVTGPVPDDLAPALTELAARIPLILAGPSAGPRPATTLDAPKARILLHLLLAAGRDRDAIAEAFATAEHPDGARL